MDRKSKRIMYCTYIALFYFNRQITLKMCSNKWKLLRNDGTFSATAHAKIEVEDKIK